MAVMMAFWWERLRVLRQPLKFVGTPETQQHGRDEYPLELPS
jgi:hypothetical protein